MTALALWPCLEFIMQAGIFDARRCDSMLTLFGSLAVASMLISYWLEARSRWFVFTFALGCAATSLYSGLVEAYPVTAIEALWALVALRRFWMRNKAGDNIPGIPA